MKILISAYACEPGQGSEPGVGWNVVREVSKYHHVWVLTSHCHRPAIETELARNPQSQLNFIYLDPFDFQINWNHQGKHTQKWVYIHYYLWQIKAYFVSCSLHKKIKFDILHHVTYVKYTSPCFLCLLPIPFIWGPVGGGELIPSNFWQSLSLYGKVYEFFRSIARSIGEYDPSVRLAAKRSVLAWATTEETACRLRQLGAKNVQLYSQLGISQEEFVSLSKDIKSNLSPVRFISVGRLISWKGFHLGLAAFAQAKLPNSEYWIIGEGCEKQNLENITQELGIRKQVKFWGNLSRNETLTKIAECYTLIHPSLHDSGGLVCLEAMAAGIPVICLNVGGPAVQVTEETGFKIPASTPEKVVNNIAQAMICLAKDADLRLRMGQAGQKRVRDIFSWELKGSFMSQCYQDVGNQQ
ncbi:glycosyltransferase family 4 protein [Nostoc sp. FACHB-152]|uniref:glycosyltransferase family 4 protein n=1 Tax=unclassified Nostoc TaxID=2593658 RepID=UPI001684944A|nr:MULTISPECIES: glycosyltransferase family 4 protein [unclassified Nostoc]MBD2445734.1 glycosyltransferase family 4 protein [Nostoc sp. FACHB-152]MBD2466848.1 glycosyltransferase family 4 protein [Nostoc sp. FACHB-145]